MSVIDLGPNAFFIGEKGGILVTPKLSDIPGASPTMAVVEKGFGNQEVVFWGNDNNFPRVVRDQAYKNPIIPRAMMFHANMTASAAILPIITEYDDEGNEILRVVKDPEIWSFLQSTQFKRYKIESASDLFWFQNIFPEIIISKDRKSVSMISPNEAMFCRWGAQNERGLCTELIHNANWPNARRLDKFTTILPTIDPYAFDVAEAVRESNRFKLAYPASYPSPGAVFYQTAFWDGIRQSKYLEFLTQIPEVKNQIMKNKIKPSFHVQIPMIHWERWFGKKWLDADHEERKRLKEGYLTRFEEVLAANKGGTLVTEFGSSQIDHKEAEKWEIVAIKDEMTDGTHNQDNIDGTVQLLCALALDASLIGYSSKESGTRNGGSDKIQALQIYIETMQPFKDVILEPLRFKAAFDGWTKRHPGLDFIAKYPNIERLNGKGKPAQSPQNKPQDGAHQ